MYLVTFHHWKSEAVVATHSEGHWPNVLILRVRNENGLDECSGTSWIRSVCEPGSKLTGQHWLVVAVRRRLLTQPLLTATPRDVDPAGVRAVRGGQQDVASTHRHTADLSVHTHTVVLTAGMEGLPAAVDPAPQVTRLTLLSCRQTQDTQHSHSYIQDNAYTAGTCH